jgi:hypothetical protein
MVFEDSCLGERVAKTSTIYVLIITIGNTNAFAFNLVGSAVRRQWGQRIFSFADSGAGWVLVSAIVKRLTHFF